MCDVVFQLAHQLKGTLTGLHGQMGKQIIHSLPKHGGGGGGVSLTAEGSLKSVTVRCMEGNIFKTFKGSEIKKKNGRQQIQRKRRWAGAQGLFQLGLTIPLLQAHNQREFYCNSSSQLIQAEHSNAPKLQPQNMLQTAHEGVGGVPPQWTLSFSHWHTGEKKDTSLSSFWKENHSQFLVS